MLAETLFKFLKLSYLLHLLFYPSDWIIINL